MNNFVISLRNAKKRRTHIQNEFGKLNISYQIFDALSPSEKLTDLITQNLPELLKSSLTETEKACFMSHFILIKQCVEQEIAFFSIFEDDVILSQDSGLFLSNSDWIPRVKDTIIKLEAFPIRISLRNRIADINNRTLFQLEQAYVGAAGYIIDLHTAKEILALIESLSYKDILPIDEILFNNFILSKKINVFQLVPAICIQEQFYKKQSELTSQLESDRKNKITNKMHKEKTNKTIFERLKKEVFRMCDKRRKITFE